MTVHPPIAGNDAGRRKSLFYDAFAKGRERPLSPTLSIYAAHSEKATDKTLSLIPQE